MTNSNTWDLSISTISYFRFKQKYGTSIKLQRGSIYDSILPFQLKEQKKNKGTNFKTKSNLILERSFILKWWNKLLKLSCSKILCKTARRLNGETEFLIHCSFLVAFCSLVITFCPLLVCFYLLLFTFILLLITFR